MKNSVINFLLFLFFIIVVPDISKASEARQYYYIQYNAKFNIMNNLHATYSTFNEETGGYDISEIDVSLSPLVPSFYGSLFLGYHFANNYALEFEIAEADIHYTKLNGALALGSNASNTYYKQQSVVISVKKDLFDIVNDSNTIYMKLGVGFTQIDWSARQPSDGGNTIDPIIQAGIGYTYVMNKFVDFDFLVRYLHNFSRVEYLISYSGLGLAAQMNEVAFFVGLKVKI